MQESFRKFAERISRIIGSVWTFLIFIVILSATGYWFHFSIEWENEVSFYIAVITLSVLFFLQKSQNHSDKATHLKLDELIRVIEGARNELMSAENQEEKDLEKLKHDFNN